MPAAQATASKATFSRFHDAVNTGDAEVISKTIDEVVEPDVLFHPPVPTGATGAQALKQAWAVLHRAFPDLHVALKDVIAEGNKVVARNKPQPGYRDTHAKGHFQDRKRPMARAAARRGCRGDVPGRRRGAGFTSHHGLGRVCPRSMTGVEAGDQDSGLRLAELVAAFSLATDLGMGQPMEHVLRSWLIAVRLGERLDLGAEARVSLYYVMVLAWVGCVADTAEVAAWFGDDIAFRGDSYRVDLAGLPLMGFALSHAGREPRCCTGFA